MMMTMTTTTTIMPPPPTLDLPNLGVLVISAICCALVLYATAFNALLKPLPGPFALPVLGNIHQVSVDKIHTIMESWADKYGPVYEV